MAKIIWQYHVQDDSGDAVKTSVIEIGGMLSALSSYGLEKQLGKLNGVYSATVNYAAGNATVRYNEAKIKIADH